MSAGAYVKSTYEVSSMSGVTCRITVQPETLEAMSDGIVNASAPGIPTLPISAQVRGSKRTLGIVARMVYLKLPSSTIAPEGYAIGSRTAIPALTSAFFVASLRSGFCLYLGTLWEVTGGKAESTR